MRNLIHNALPMLLCSGNEQHIAPMPRVYSEGVTGAVECTSCGEPMIAVDVIVTDRRPTWGSLPERGGHYYS